MDTEMLALELEQSLKLLVQHTARAFYEPSQIIIMDILIIQRVIRKDVLVERLDISVKEVDKMVELLVEDGLVQCHRANDLDDNESQPTPIYYYLDYVRFIRVVKWRIKNMRQTLMSRIAIAVSESGFICTRCKRRYKQLEAIDLLDQRSKTLVCNVCHAEVCDDDEDESITSSHSLMARFDHQTRFIVADLRVAETLMVLPFDVSAAIPPCLASENLAHSQQRADTSGELQALLRPTPIRVLLIPDSSTMGSQAEGSSFSRRYDDELPAWHVKSAIADQLTMDMRRAQAESTEGVRERITRTVHNDPTLRGLGSSWPPLKGDTFGNEELRSAELDEYYMKLASKRSRSPDDENRGSAKQTRLEDLHHTLDISRDLIVSVAGQPREISNLTPEDCASMDDSEYSAFIDAITLPLE